MTESKLINYVDFIEFASLDRKSAKEFLSLMDDVSEIYHRGNDDDNKRGAQMALNLMAFNALTIVSTDGKDLFPALPAQKIFAVEQTVKALDENPSDGFSNSFDDNKRMATISQTLHKHNMTIAKKLPEIV